MAGDAKSSRPGETQKCWSTCLRKGRLAKSCTPSENVAAFRKPSFILPGEVRSPSTQQRFLSPPHAAGDHMRSRVRLRACLAHPCGPRQCVMGRAGKGLSSQHEALNKYSVMGWNLGLTATLETAKFDLPIHKTENRGLDRLSGT